LLPVAFSMDDIFTGHKTFHEALFFLEYHLLPRINCIGVRAYIGATGIARRWVKNFAETSRPLTRLMGDVEWIWADSEQLSFEFLCTRCADIIEAHGILYDIGVRMYSNASKYGGGCVITKMRKPSPDTKSCTSPESFPLKKSSIQFSTIIYILFNSTKLWYLKTRAPRDGRVCSKIRLPIPQTSSERLPHRS
jgi:hypothetical protein